MLSRLFGKKNKAVQVQPVSSVISQEELDYAFHFAVQSHDLAKAKEYAVQGANINAAPEGHTPALISSVRDKHAEITDWLLTQKPDMERVDRFGKTALMTAVDHGAVWVGKIITAGANPNTQDSKGWTALEYALRQNHVESAQILIDVLKDLTQPLSDGSTPADYTRENGMPALAEQIAQKEQDKAKAAAEALKPETKQLVTVMKRIRLKKDGLNT
ncbi:MAG TPA: ankyrin repeat domain-containing protein [Alphaproteobacteria bacterium]|nr:ankyrin repeat domain-containing protein [Alphaproteobacteria bacterium]